MARHAHAGACISATKVARAQVPARRVYNMHAPIEGVQASQSHFDQPLQHTSAPKCSREDALHTDNRPRRMQGPRRTHLSNPEMHASGARMSRRKRLLAPKDACADGGDTRLGTPKDACVKIICNWGFHSPGNQCWGFHSLRDRRWGFYLPRNL